MRTTKKTAFTLIELLVVIAIIALLLSVILPSLRKAKQAAQSIVCRNHLKTLALSNGIYASEWDNWYVPVIDTTMVARGEPTWNSNSAFRKLVGLEDAYVGSSWVLPKEYLCPSDEQSDEDYWNWSGGSFPNFASYGYNFTDWGPDSKDPAGWSGNIPLADWSCRFRVNNIRASGSKIMFIDAGDIWAEMGGADYKLYWDQDGQDIVKHRAKGMWRPVYYRHNEGANVAFFDGHVDHRKKESLFYYDPPESTTPAQGQNGSLWFCVPEHRKL